MDTYAYAEKYWPHVNEDKVLMFDLFETKAHYKYDVTKSGYENFILGIFYKIKFRIQL